MMIVGALFYVLLWVLAVNGVTSLIAPLVIPLVLVVLIISGVALDRYLGISHRHQHFQEHDETEQ